jgi:peptidoglycan/LPS O-acetylase OafA/YrhL
MFRRLFLLNGLSIFAVVCNHAGYLGFLAMFWWPNLYRPVAVVPNFDLMGTFPYYALLTIRQLAVFCVPSFLFTSGFFLAYAARGNQSALTWKVVLKRILFLLIPYLIWSLIWFGFDYSRGNTYSLIEYIKRLIVGNANHTYFYVIVLCQLYLFSPIIVPLVKRKWKLFLMASALILLISLALKYENTFRAPITSPLRFIISNWFVTLWLLYFALGVAFSFLQSDFTQLIQKYKWVLLIATIIMGILSIVEADKGFRILKEDWPGPTTFTSSLYVIAFIFSFLAFREFKLPFSNFFNLLGRNIYGIYLIHWIVLEIAVLFIQAQVPFVLASELILQSLLIILGVGVPLLLINLLSRTSARQASRYLFG